MYDISYKDESARSHGLYVTKRPSIPPPQEEIETFVVGGRDGILTGNRRLLPLVFNIEFGFRTVPGKWAERMRDIKRWLSGSGKLIQSDDAEYYFRVLSIAVPDVERTLKRLGTFQAEFTCDPYMYRVDGAEIYGISDDAIKYNYYDESHPTYLIYGTGQRSLTVNGSTVAVTGTGTMVIDTDRMITYSNATGTPANTSISGNYEDLYLKPGNNSISCSASAGVIPNWRCR